jgi:hypothetical protein
MAQVASDGTASGLLMLNSNGMDIYVQDDIVTWKYALWEAGGLGA